MHVVTLSCEILGFSRS